MAKSDIIKHTDIAEEGAVRDYLQKEFSDLVAYLPTVEAATLKLAKNFKETFSNFKIENLDDVKKLSEGVKQVNEAETVHAKIQKVKIELSAQQIAQSQIDKQNKRDEITLLKAQISEMDKSVNSIKKLNAENAALRVQVRNANIATKEGADNVAKWNAQINNNTTVIKANSDKLIQAKMNVGNYTESITNALSRTGLLGQSISTLTGIYEGLKDIIGVYKARQEAATAADAANTATKEVNIAATETEAVAKETDIIATETDTTVTEINTAANKANSVSKLGIAGAIIIAVAALYELGKAYENSTQAGKDNLDVLGQLKDLALKNPIVTEQNYKAIYKLLQAEKDLHDERTKNSIKIQELETKAAILRASAQDDFRINEKTRKEEINTTEDKIKSLHGYLGALKEVSDIKTDEAQKEYDRAQALADIESVTGNKREFADKAAAAKVALEAVQEEFANQTKKGRLRLAALQREFDKEIISIQQETEKRELGLRKTFNENKIIELTKQRDKEIDQNNLDTKQKIENEKHKQDLLGEFDENGKSKKALYIRDLKSIQDEGDAKNIETTRKTEEAIQKVKDEIFDKESARLKKISDANAKQAEKDFQITSARLAEEESAEIFAIEKSYQKKKDFSVKAEEEKQKAIDAIKLKYFLIDKKRNEDDPKKQFEIQKQIDELELAALQRSGKNELKEKEAFAKQVQKLEDEITDGIKEGLQTRSELRQQADQHDIDFHTRMLDVQAKLAAEGKDNVLAEELAAATRAEEKKLQDAKKAAKLQEDIELVKVFSDTLNKALEKGDSFFKAFAEAAGATGVVKTMFAKLFSGGFAEGVENLQGKGTAKSDSNIALLSKGESVTTAEGTAQTPGLVTKVNDKGYEGAVEWAFANIYKPQFQSTTVSSRQPKEDSGIKELAYIFTNKIDELKSEIRSKQVSNIRLEKLGEWVDEVQDKGLKTIIHHKKNSIRPSLRLNS